MITKEMLRQDEPDDTTINGYCPVVLALVDLDKFYCKDNTYIPAWNVVNATWYKKHKDQYLGWYPLEFIDLSHITKDCASEEELDKFFEELFNPNINDTKNDT